MSKLMKCKTCEEEMAKEAKICPKCGAKNKRIGAGGWIFLTLFAMGFWSYLQYEPPKPSTYPTNSETYAQVAAQVGCDSQYGDQKKADIFKQYYKNQWFTWKGKVVLVDDNNISLNTNYSGIQDLVVYFDSSSAIYNLSKDKNVTVKFLLTSAGGCFLPFTGKHGKLI